jgi:hypothetical protein
MMTYCRSLITVWRVALRPGKPLVSEAIGQAGFTSPGAGMLFCRAALLLSSRTLTAGRPAKPAKVMGR